MVLDDQQFSAASASNGADETLYTFGSTTSLAAAAARGDGGGDIKMKINERPEHSSSNSSGGDNIEPQISRSFKMPYQQSFKESDWSQLAEATLPLKISRYLTTTTRDGDRAARRRSSPYMPLMAHQSGYGAFGGPLNCSSAAAAGAEDHHPDKNHPNSQFANNSLLNYNNNNDDDDDDDAARRIRRHSAANDTYTAASAPRPFDCQASIECRSRQMSRRLILVNSISLLVNLLLALVAFYFSFKNNSSSTTAFAADCVLDLISSAIVLWRYYGDLRDVYMHAREQIACIYLGALFELSALGIIIKASSDIASGVEPSEALPGYDLIYLAAVATIACSILIVFKWSLYRTIRDASILLDVINTFVSTLFAITLCLMTVLSNVDSSFWYFDPILSIILALFMAGFGLKVIHQNFHVLRPGYQDSHGILGGSPFAKLPLLNRDNQRQQHRGQQYETNLNTSLSYNQANWQKTDYSSIAFV